MPKVISISKTRRSPARPVKPGAQRNPRYLTSDDYRRLLSDMRLRPPSQRAFLRKFLKRAAATGVPIVFPVATHVVLAP